MINGHNLVNGNCVTLWKELIETQKPFPKEVLIKNRLTLKDLIKRTISDKKTTVHFTDSALIQATNPITVNLIGAGGTGSQVLTALARINHALNEFNHAGLEVRLWDDDTVATANLGRQLFAGCELVLVVYKMGVRKFDSQKRQATEII